MKISYNWLKWYIPNAPKPEELQDILTYHLTEVEGIETLDDRDVILDVNILPNRAHDLLSHKGLALEISGQLGIDFTEPAGHYESILAKKEIKKTDLKINVESDMVRRYQARIIRNIKIGPSPEWIVKHLESIGQRSINNIVDATNLLMFNCGQPAHAFDLRKFSDNKIVIKNAVDDEELELVGREKIIAKLKNTDLIAVNSSNETLGLVGVKGGVNSGIQDDTADIVLECANFDPITIRKTARRIGVLSDAAKRFENDLTPELCSYGMLELTALIAEMCPDAVIEEVVDYYPHTQNETKIAFTADFINKKLGSNIENSDIENILKNYKYEYNFDGADFSVTVPVFRLDLACKEDMVEEIGRIYGYDKVAPVMPVLDFKPNLNEQYEKIESARNALIHAGYRETMTYTFTKKGDIQVARGTKGKDYLRTNLLDGLKESYELNKNNAPLILLDEVKIFEIGIVFANGKEEIHVAYVNKKEAKEFSLYDITESEMLSEKSSGLLAEIKSQLGQTFPESISDSASLAFQPWSIYPFITRDISVWVPADFDKKDLEYIYNSGGNDLLAVPAYMVDTFQKDSRISYSYRLVFQAKDRTLESDEVTKIIDKITIELQKINGLEIR